METGVKEVELRDLWRRYKNDGDAARPRAAGGRLLADGQIRRRPARRRPALPCRRRRPDLLRPDGPDRRDRALRARAGDQIRDLRDDPDPRRDHRRAALAGLGARSVRSRAREIEAAQAKLEHELQRAPTEEELAAKLGIDEEELQTSLLEIANSSVYALDELWTVSDSSGDQVSLLDTISDPRADDPQEALPAARSRTG